jgi:hypothetical protein
VQPRRYLVSFATPEFYRSRAGLVSSARRHGVSEAFSFTGRDLKKTSFYRRSRHILGQRRGGGYWLWKPYFILEAMQSVPEGSIILYADAGIEVTGDLTPLFDIVVDRGGSLLFCNEGRSNRVWTKRDCFVLMGCDSEAFWDAENITAGFHLHVNNRAGRGFIREWLEFCLDDRILTDRPNTCGLPNLPGFIEHRHDQSILAILAKKHAIEIFRDPSQFGNPYKLEEFRANGEFLDMPYSERPYWNSPYGTLLDCHRQRHYSVLLRLRLIARGLVRRARAMYARRPDLTGEAL